MRAMAVPWKALRRQGVRILAYHGVPDGVLFRNQVSHLVSHYSPVGGIGGPEGPKPMVWVTFDDGDPSIVDVGLPVLQDFDLVATAFICPGVVDTEEPFWWQVVESAVARGVSVEGTPIVLDELSVLKTVPDKQRRERVARIRLSLEDHLGEPFRVRQLTTDEVRRWLAAGNAVGNHTWDHPVLSNCSPDEQTRQIVTADRWLDEKGMNTDVFAYPNGSWSPASESALSQAGYRIGLLFDHRIADSAVGLSVSRIRVNGTDPMDEFIAKVSGIHPALRHAVGP